MPACWKHLKTFWDDSSHPYNRTHNRSSGCSPLLPTPMKLKGKLPPPPLAEIEVSPSAVFQALRQEFINAYNTELRQLGALKDKPFIGYDNFFVKDGKLYGEYEEGRHPRNTEYKDEMTWGVEQWMGVFTTLKTLSPLVTRIFPLNP